MIDPDPVGWHHPVVPQELRDRAEETALHMAETAVHLEYLRDAFELARLGLEDEGLRVNG